MDGPQKQEEGVHLRREIGLLSAICFIIGTVVGSGIFIAPKGVLMNSGSVGLSLLVWALSGVLSMFGALCYAELCTTFTKSGATYIYLLETLGPLPAFLRLWVEFFFIRPSAASYVSLAFSSYVVEPFYTPCAPPTAVIKLVAILGFTFVVAVNCWSVTIASRIQIVLTFIKLFALVLIIIPGAVALAKGRSLSLFLLRCGVFLHRGDVSVLGPLDHREELCSHTDWDPSLLSDHLPLLLAPQLETRLQLLEQKSADPSRSDSTGGPDILKITFY